jgi:hypothetical protein
MTEIFRRDLIKHTGSTLFGAAVVCSRLGDISTRTPEFDKSILSFRME